MVLGLPLSFYFRRVPVMPLWVCGSGDCGRGGTSGVYLPVSMHVGVDLAIIVKPILLLAAVEYRE